MNETKELLSKTYKLSYDPEMDVVFHWSQKRGWVPLSERKNGKVAYYLFKHEGKTTYVSKIAVVEAFVEELKRQRIHYFLGIRGDAMPLDDLCKTVKLYTVEETEREEDN